MLWKLAKYGWRAMTEAHTIYWICVDLMGMTVPPAILTAIIAAFGKHSLAALIVIFVLALIVSVLLVLMFIGYRADKRSRQEPLTSAQPHTVSASQQERSALIISGPHIFKDRRYQDQTRWRMKVRTGPVAALNPLMKLRSADRGPRDRAWNADYPYPIIPVGSALGDVEHQINPNDDKDYEVMWVWETQGKFLTGLDTKNSGHQIQIHQDERWELNYEFTSSSADPITFSLLIYVEAGVVNVVRCEE